MALSLGLRLIESHQQKHRLLESQSGFLPEESKIRNRKLNQIQTKLKE